MLPERIVAVKRHRARQELVRPEEHFEPDANAPARLALLLREFLRPGQAHPRLEHEPVARHAAPVSQLDAVVSQRHVVIELVLAEDLRGRGAPIRQSAQQHQRRVAAHTLGALGNRP
jgi:hypothetical protein